jgi:hypothetical protein
MEQRTPHILPHFMLFGLIFNVKPKLQIVLWIIHNSSLRGAF